MSEFLTRRSLADEVASKIREQITLGIYRIEEKIPIEPDLMKRFGVGRSTIREAIKILVNSGLLRVQQGVGTFVQNIAPVGEPIHQKLSRAKMHDLDEVRKLLEMKIAETAAIQRTQSDILAIEKHLEERQRYAEAGHLEDCITADIHFHIAIAEASKNEFLADLYKSTAIHLKNWFSQTYQDTSAFIETQLLHEQLLQSIIKKDPKACWSIAAKILDHISQ